MPERTENRSVPGGDPRFAEERRAAYAYVSEAIAEGRLDGIDGDCLAHAALFAALVELVAGHGEEAVAKFAENLPQRLLDGEYSIYEKH